MEQFKFALGPYELFASIVGGFPLTLAICLAYNPTTSLQDIISIIQGNFSTQIAIAFIFFSYILGGLVQGITWKYFLILCQIFRQDYRYFGNMIEDKNKSIKDIDETTDVKTLDFEDKLILLLREKIGIPKKISWMSARLTSYLKEHNRPSLITAESFQANHIMYRNISFGSLILSITILVNLFKVGQFSFYSLSFIILSIGLSLIAFLRSISFKKWHEREILLGFYFAAIDDKQR